MRKPFLTPPVTDSTAFINSRQSPFKHEIWQPHSRSVTRGDKGQLVSVLEGAVFFLLVLPAMVVCVG